MKNKKGQGAINFLRIAVIALVIATISLSIVLRVNETVTPSMRGTVTGIVNESLGVITANTATALANEDLVPGSDRVYVNRTGAFDLLIRGQNYTISNSAGVVTVNDTKYDGGNNQTNVSYSFYPHPAAYNASVLGTTGLATFADYWTVIAIVIVLAVIIALFGIFGAGAVGGVEIR